MLSPAGLRFFVCRGLEGQAAVPFPEREEPTDCASCLLFGIWIKKIHFVIIKVQKGYFTKKEEQTWVQ